MQFCKLPKEIQKEYVEQAKILAQTEMYKMIEEKLK